VLKVPLNFNQSLEVAYISPFLAILFCWLCKPLRSQRGGGNLSPRVVFAKSHLVIKRDSSFLLHCHWILGLRG